MLKVTQTYYPYNYSLFNSRRKSVYKTVYIKMTVGKMDVYVLYHWAVWLFIIKSTKPVRGYFLKTRTIRLAGDKPARKPACR